MPLFDWLNFLRSSRRVTRQQIRIRKREYLHWCHSIAAIERYEDRLVLIPPSSGMQVLITGGGNVIEGNSGTTMVSFMVSLADGNVATSDIAVPWSASGTGITPTDAADFVDASGSATIPTGMSSSTFWLNINGDLDVEPNETFDVTISVGTPSSAGGTIQTDDSVTPTPTPTPAPTPAPIVTISEGGTVTEGDSATTLLPFTVSLNGTAAADVIVPWFVPVTSQTDSADFVNTTGSVTILAGSISETIYLEIVGDTDLELDEVFVSVRRNTYLLSW